jgi:hypothetical protein
LSWFYFHYRPDEGNLEYAMRQITVAVHGGMSIRDGAGLVCEMRNDRALDEVDRRAAVLGAGGQYGPDAQAVG